MVVVDFHQVFHLSSAEISFPEETSCHDLIFQILQDLNGLIRKAVKFSFGKVKPVVVASLEIIDEDKNGENQDNDKNQVTRIDEGFSLKALFKNREIKDDICC